MDLDWLEEAVRLRGDDGQARHDGVALDRRRAAREERRHRPADTNLRAIIFWGHAPNSQSRGLEMVEAMEKLDLMVVVDPYPSASARRCSRMVRKDGAYLLPVATQLETEGSATCSNRSLAVAREGDRARCSSRAPTT